MEYIKGPDLPTGGILIGKNSLFLLMKQEKEK